MVRREGERVKYRIQQVFYSRVDEVALPAEAVGITMRVSWGGSETQPAVFEICYLVPVPE